MIDLPSTNKSEKIAPMPRSRKSVGGIFKSIQIKMAAKMLKTKLI